ncbi:hypothetical protein PTKIN_Ptkin14bG0082900 [Pterospermum kingtungense]
MASILDDIYDAYDTYEELEILTRAIHRLKDNVKPSLLRPNGFMKSTHPRWKYKPIGLVSCGYFMLGIASFVGMEDTITKETFIRALNESKILIASATICRLMSDIVGHKFEQERGHIPSTVDCYVKQYGISEQEANSELNKKINDPLPFNGSVLQR